jgi:hypothetical protein
MFEPRDGLLYSSGRRGQHEPGTDENPVGRNAWRCVAIMSLLAAVTGCSDLTGAGAAAGRQDEKPSRNVDQQVDAVMKDFRNE